MTFEASAATYASKRFRPRFSVSDTLCHSPLDNVRKKLEEREDLWLSPHAARSRFALRRNPDPKALHGHRLQFAIDVDRVLHSLSYARYIDKTQVFYLIRNDHITHRVLHVQLLSKIARTVGRLLRLNEDLIEAIALGHDIGHPPFGHDGEEILDALCREHGMPSYQHSIQSVRFLEQIESGGKGLNLSLQVLDGIFCHDGERLLSSIKPVHRSRFEELDRDLARKQEDRNLEPLPGTLEGAVVRIADVISYVGRDLEDAMRLNLVRPEQIPPNVVKTLGRSNGTIVYRLVEDVAESSLDRDTLCLSEGMVHALGELLNFNREHIYSNPLIKTERPKIARLYAELFTGFLEDLRLERTDSEIFLDYLDQMQRDYVDTHSHEEVVRDFIAGMTDRYFLQCARRRLIPQHLPDRF
ncbi:MAG: HD domain-containing protein [Deltaproteobacteria bacterium]|nr:HD domain-containing protein [Deltaproteobacteria bacterium]